jgi:hypothetical protein
MTDEQPRRVVVRFALEPDLIVTSNLTIAEIKELIRSQRPALREKFLRIIHSGRVLEDANRVPIPEEQPEQREPPVRDISIPLKGSRSNEKGRPGSRSSGAADEGPNPNQPIYLHCAASDFASEGGPVEPNATIRPQLGLERLLGVGFSADEVSSIRQQFHAFRGTDATDEDSARRLEESWIDANQNNVVGDNPFFGNSPQDLLFGLLIGFFLGILCLLFVREPIFNRRIQVGIVLGLIFNVSFGIAKLL